MWTNDDREYRVEDEEVIYPPDIECPKCGSVETTCVGGDSVMHIGRGMIHESHYRCAICKHWWREEDEY